LLGDLKSWMVLLLKVYLYINALDESIPIRLFLQAYNHLSPTFLNVGIKFSVQYFLNLVLIDVEDRRYFKQIEINLMRLEKGKKLPKLSMTNTNDNSLTPEDKEDNN
jgi:hypothetical protein